MTKNQSFEEWINNNYFLGLKYGSGILFGNKSQQERFVRIKQVAILLLKNPNKSIEQLREEIALDFFVSMRVALDYINYAKILIDKWKKNNV